MAYVSSFRPNLEWKEQDIEVCCVVLEERVVLGIAKYLRY